MRLGGQSLITTKKNLLHGCRQPGCCGRKKDETCQTFRFFLSSDILFDTARLYAFQCSQMET